MRRVDLCEIKISVLITTSSIALLKEDLLYYVPFAQLIKRLKCQKITTACLVYLAPYSQTTYISLFLCQLKLSKK